MKYYSKYEICIFAMSPSTRREWIEIIHSVIELLIRRKSPSTRREWIEIAGV